MIQAPADRDRHAPAPPVDEITASPGALAAQVYRGVLGRPVDRSGLAHVTALLREEGLDGLGTAIRRMLASEEFRAHWRARFASDAFLWPDGSPDLMVLDLSDRRARRCLGTGWHDPEPSWTWASGQRSDLQFDATGWSEDATLFLEIVTAGHPDVRPEQRLSVWVNGVAVGRFVIAHRRPCTLICHVPSAALTAKAGLQIAIEHPDGFVPTDLQEEFADTRDLSFALRELRLERLTPARRARHDWLKAGIAQPIASSTAAARDGEADLATIAERFESLGSNCELGFVQRAAGSEAISFLRFSGLPFHKLLRGLRSGFADLAAPGRFHMSANTVQADYIGRDELYLLDYHTGRAQGAVDPQVLLSEETARVRYLARKLIEDVEDGLKILVVKDDVGLAIEQIASLLELIAARGRAILLWVDLAGPARPPGLVEVIGPGLMRGYIDRFGDLEIGTHTISHECWHLLLSRALGLTAAAQP